MHKMRNMCLGCPEDVLILKKDSVEIINNNLCISCGHYAVICPEDAIAPNEL